MVIVKVNAPERWTFKNPSHLTPTEPPVDPTLETPAGTPDPQSKRIEGSIWAPSEKGQDKVYVWLDGMGRLGRTFNKRRYR